MDQKQSSEQKEIIDIKGVVEALQQVDSDQILKKKKLFGIMLDATCPKKTSTLDRMQMIKLIDDSYNGYLTLFIYSQNDNDFVPTEQIGDIIYLKRYHYKIYKNEPQAKKNAYKTSQILLFDGDNLQLKFNPNDSKPLNEYEGQRIKQLHQFSKQFFQKNSLLSLYWYGCLNSGIYDVMMKLIKYEDGNIVYFEDQSKNQYKLISQTVHNSEIPINTLVKLRSISISTENQIIIQQYSSLLVLPTNCYDQQHFYELEQLIVKCDGSPDDFIRLTPDSCTQIKKKWQHLNDSPEILLIQGELMNVAPATFKDALVFFNQTQSVSYQEVLSLNLDVSQMQQSLYVKLQILQENTYSEAIVFLNNKFFGFEQSLDLAQIDHFEKQFDETIRRLLLSNSVVHCDLVVQKKSHQDQDLYMIIDTKL